MKGRGKRQLAGALAIMGLLGAGLWCFRGASAGAPDTVDAALRQALAASSAEAGTGADATADATAPARRLSVDPALVQHKGGRAYTIVRTGLYRPPGDAKAQVLALKQRSDAGDAMASYQIHLSVLDCKQLMTGSPEESWQRLKDAGMNPDPAFLAGIETRLGECAALSQDAALVNAPWLALAAEQGSAEAGLLYYISPESVLGEPREWLSHPERVQEWRDNALRYLQAGANDGFVDAVAALGRAYQTGIVVDQDPLAAYAYTLAAGRSEPVYVSETMIAGFRDALSPAQQAEAQVRARKIYAACCAP